METEPFVPVFEPIMFHRGWITNSIQDTDYQLPQKTLIRRIVIAGPAQPEKATCL